MAEFNIGNEFSHDPAGRIYKDGPGNGERFREEYLKEKIALLAKNETLLIILDDDVETYGSSFLTEGFAGMVKYGYIEADDLLKKLLFKYSNPDYEFYVRKIKKYVKEAHFDSKQYVSSKEK